MEQHPGLAGVLAGGAAPFQGRFAGFPVFPPPRLFLLPALEVRIRLFFAETVDRFAGFGLTQFLARQPLNVLGVRGKQLLLPAQRLNFLFLAAVFLIKGGDLALAFLVLPDFRQEGADHGNNHYRRKNNRCDPVKRKPEFHPAEAAHRDKAQSRKENIK
jgi:hypothetical protein